MKRDPWPHEYAMRRKRYRGLMSREGLDGLLITHLPDVRYLCGFSGSSAMAVLLRDRGYLLTDFRYRERSAREVRGLRAVVSEAALDEAAAGVLRGRSGLRLGFDGSAVSYAGAVALRRRLRGTARLVPLRGSLGLLRAPKSRAELDMIRKSVSIAERAFRKALACAGGGTTEAGLALALDTAARGMGAGPAPFETIVTGGRRAAAAHARPTRARLAGAAVIDWGVERGGYCTDTTRTVAFGRVPAEIRKAHRLVLEAQSLAMAEIRPGAKAGKVDRAARDALEKAGYGHAFGHGVGHGVGLEVHERPYLGRASRDVLEEGMVLTVEPGIYLPGTGGVRVEDMVLVAASGAEFLTTLPRSLDPSDYL